MKNLGFITKKDVATLFGVIASVIIPKLIFGEEYIEYVDIEEDIIDPEEIVEIESATDDGGDADEPA